MHRKKMHYTEVIPLPKRRTAQAWHIGAVIEDIVGWICVLACAALLIFLSSRPITATQFNALFFSKIFSNETHQTVDKSLSGLGGDPAGRRFKNGRWLFLIGVSRHARRDRQVAGPMHVHFGKRSTHAAASGGAACNIQSVDTTQCIDPGQRAMTNFRRQS